MKFNTMKLQQKIQPIVNKVSGNRYLKAIMGGLMAAFPATMIGSLASLLKALPIDSYQSFITSHGIDKILQLPVIFTTNILALIFVFCITYSLAQSFDLKGISPSLVALVSFLLATPLQTVKNVNGMNANVIPMEWLGAAGMFSAIIISIVTVKLYTYIVKKGWTIKMPESVPPFIKDSFASVIPGVIITSIFLIISAIFTNTQYGSMHGFIYNMFQIPLQNLGGNFGALIIVSIISQVLWVMGVHGSMVALSVMSPIWRVLDTAQLTAYSAGNPLPNIIGMNFYRVFTFGGTVLGLAILMLRARSVRFKTLGKLSIIPALFGITEPIIFGTPLVLNPLLAIPFIFGNVISLILAYIATLAGFLPKLTGISVPTGVPVGVQGLVMGGWRIAVFQLVLVLLSIALWYPFFKITDNKALKEENELVQKQ